ncbi:hypothetical protein [Brumicola nitratireducens]|uniref:Uncharacterized protein n=1 Tax=Glaciecola nitratireducens (strain JCM 12485 / KCTC 12276 / FR1064) TaxID=1085623 RepID=G4QKM0_GLANF|nr:hypothetical protein [Glaciecola nitratireducens]AEP30086.1 hypothetical protein GNIT_1977 [Glaciecola nitratireducens FR1064]
MYEVGQYFDYCMPQRAWKCITTNKALSNKALIAISRRLCALRIINNAAFLKTMLIGFALLMLNACGSGTSDAAMLSPMQMPSSQIRLYQLGDMLEFSGDVRISKRDEPIFISNVTVLAEFKPGRLRYQDKKVFTLRTITTFLATGEQQIDTQDIWQEPSGQLFELSNKYGNEYVVGTVFDKGLLAIPIPLINLDKKSIDFFSLYGGAASGPITEGNREISVEVAHSIPTALGNYKANKITHKESYKYLFTYVNNKRGTTVATDRSLWVSPDKGILKKVEVRRVLSASGALLSESQWELDIKSINF